MRSSDELSAIFAALADPTRRAILGSLLEGERSVLELARPFDMTLPGISKHLKVLERAGLITRGRRAQWRPCRLEASPLRDVAQWIEHYRPFWDEGVDGLDAYVKQFEEEQRDAGRRRHDNTDGRPPNGIPGQEEMQRAIA